MDDPAKESIFSIIGRMEVMLKYFESKPQFCGLVPFLKTYCIVTKAVAHKSAEFENYFKDSDKLESLDIHFASLYFESLRTFLETGRCLKPWQTYFKYCQDGSNSFVQMLLGINAHVNGDLARALIETNYRQKQDFLKINEVLEEVIPNIMHFLFIHQRDPVGLGGLVFRRFVTSEFHNIVVKWRKDAWRNATKGAKSGKFRNGLSLKTERVAKDIIRVFERIFKFSHPISAFEHLHELRVRL